MMVLEACGVLIAVASFCFVRGCRIEYDVLIFAWSLLLHSLWRVFEPFLL